MWGSIFKHSVRPHKDKLQVLAIKASVQAFLLHIRKTCEISVLDLIKSSCIRGKIALWRNPWSDYNRPCLKIIDIFVLFVSSRQKCIRIVRICSIYPFWVMLHIHVVINVAIGSEERK